MTKNLKIMLGVGAVVLLALVMWALGPLRPVPKPSTDTQVPSSQMPTPSESEAAKPPEMVPPEIINDTKPATPAKDNESVRLFNLKKDDTIKSPLIIKGEALGTWFFEASFPIQIVDDKGQQLGQGIATAKGDWMKTTYVPFEARITYTTKGSLNGMVIFSKDNPSGLPEHAEGMVVMVKFAQQAPQTTGQVMPPPLTAQTTAACRPTGCSGQVCSDTDVISTCEYRSEYACYKTASCARQSDGKCGWTQTPELKKCIETAPKDAQGPQ